DRSAIGAPRARADRIARCRRRGAQGRVRRGAVRLLLLPLLAAAQPRDRAVGEIEESIEQRLQLGRIADAFEAIVLDAVGKPVAVGGAFLVGREREPGELRPGEVDLYAPAGPLAQGLDAHSQRGIASPLDLRLVPGLDALEDLHARMLRPPLARRQLSPASGDFARSADAGRDRAVHGAARALEIRRLAGEMEGPDPVRKR